MKKVFLATNGKYNINIYLKNSEYLFVFNEEKDRYNNVTLPKTWLFCNVFWKFFRKKYSIKIDTVGLSPKIKRIYDIKKQLTQLGHKGDDILKSFTKFYDNVNAKSYEQINDFFISEIKKITSTNVAIKIYAHNNTTLIGQGFDLKAAYKDLRRQIESHYTSSAYLYINRQRTPNSYGYTGYEAGVYTDHFNYYYHIDIIGKDEAHDYNNFSSDQEIKAMEAIMSKFKRP